MEQGTAMSMLVGYARVSSAGQSLDIQLEALKAAGCERVFSEKKSGTSAGARDELQDALDFVREGDTLVVTRLDRLARSSNDLHNIIARLTGKGVKFRCLQQSGVDTDSGMGKLVLAILGAVAEFETDIRRERQREGIEKAKAEGVYKGRKPSVDVARVRELRDAGMKPSAIAKELEIGRTSVWRALEPIKSRGS
jgi:DNA invertase Pin-like site-specific DNA recombinase